MKGSAPAAAASASAGLLLLPHVSCDGGADLRAPFVLSKIIHKLSVGSHQVHDDGVIHLKAAEGEQSWAFPHGWGCYRVETHDVVVVLVFGTLTVINSVGSGDLLHLSRRARQADQLGGKL